MKKQYLLLSCLVALLGISFLVIAQEKHKIKPDETKAEVPALESFHDVIYKIWHTAWPEKDVKMLAELTPEVQQYGDALVKAELPGILRDKKGTWKEQIGKLESIIKTYKQFSSPIDSQKLLDAAEQLHGQFEKLVRVIRPALKEIDEFHTVLYSIYHYYLPESNKEKLTSSIKELKLKMAELNKATLSERMKAKVAVFKKARAKLSASVDAVVAAEATKEMKTIKSSIETMHTDYQALEKVFE